MNASLRGGRERVCVGRYVRLRLGHQIEICKKKKHHGTGDHHIIESKVNTRATIAID